MEIIIKEKGKEWWKSERLLKERCETCRKLRFCRRQYFYFSIEAAIRGCEIHSKIPVGESYYGKVAKRKPVTLLQKTELQVFLCESAFSQNTFGRLAVLSENILKNSRSENYWKLSHL